MLERHPDAEIISSLPGLGVVLGARVLGEFGDEPNRYADAKGRKAYAGTAPITKASGRSQVVLARVARNRRLADACENGAFRSLTRSPGARNYYDLLRARARPTAKHFVSWPTAGSGSFMAAWQRACATRRRSPGSPTREPPFAPLDA